MSTPLSHSSFIYEPGGLPIIMIAQGADTSTVPDCSFMWSWGPQRVTRTIFLDIKKLIFVSEWQDILSIFDKLCPSDIKLRNERKIARIFLGSEQYVGFYMGSRGPQRANTLFLYGVIMGSRC